VDVVSSLGTARVHSVDDVSSVGKARVDQRG
jgi:hypothetical protein